MYVTSRLEFLALTLHGNVQLPGMCIRLHKSRNVSGIERMMSVYIWGQGKRIRGGDGGKEKEKDSMF